MGEASIPVDVFNPGQVFACLGFLEAADILLGDAEGGFDWSDKANVRFRMCAPGSESPIVVVLNFLRTARVLSLAPFGSSNDTLQWSIPTEAVSPDDAFPFPDPPSPATLPAVLEGSITADGGRLVRLIIDHWGDATCRDTIKFWGGSAGYPGAALARDALNLVRDRCCDSVSDPFNLSAEQSSSFRLDWRRDYIPIDAGFSLNSHNGRIAAVGYPLVEILAAVGLSNARPKRIWVLEYKYGVIGFEGRAARGKENFFFEPALMRAALGGSDLPFSQRSYRTFRMRLGWPAKEGQARAITTVTEERIHD